MNSLIARQDTCVSTALKHGVLWYALCFALLWLYVSPLLLQNSFLRMNTDEANYVWKAEQISRDVGALASERVWRRHPPLIPAIVGVLAKLMSLEMAVLITTKTLALAGLVMVYVVGVQLKTPMAGLIASVLLAADPTYRSLSNKLLLDIPLMLLFVGCAALLLKGGRYKIWAVVAGIVALSVKNYGILVLVYALECIAWDFFVQRGWRPAKVLSIVGVSSAVALVPLGYYQGHIPCCDWLAWGAWLQHEAQLKIWSILDTSIGWMVPGVPKRYLGTFLLLTLPFFVKMLSFSESRANVVLFAWIVTILAPFLFAYTGDDRVILLFAPALYLIVGLCLAQALDLVKTPAARRSMFAVLALSAVFVLLLAQRNPSVLHYTNCRFRAYHPAGEWIRQNISRSDAVVFTRSSHQVRFYAKSEFEKDGGIFYGYDEWTGIPWSVPEFDRVLDEAEKPAFLIMDIEEKADPPWLYPPTRVAAETIQRLGFRPVHLVWVPVNSFCDIPNSPYYSRLPDFMKQLGLPFYRHTGAARESLGAIIFQRNGRSVVTAKEPALRVEAIRSTEP